MPLYEYDCRPCGRRFEALVRLASANEPQTCPECGKPTAKRVLSAPAALGTGKTITGSGCSPRGGFG